MKRILALTLCFAFPLFAQEAVNPFEDLLDFDQTDSPFDFGDTDFGKAFDPPRKPKAPAEPMVVLSNGVQGVFPVMPSAFENVVTRSVPDNSDRDNDFITMDRDVTVERTNVREFFEKLGLPLPPGSWITYNAGISSVIVYNTPENMEIFRYLLRQINVVPLQVQFDLSIVAFKKEELEAFARGRDAAAVSQKEVKQAWRSGKGKLVKTGRVTTRTGLNALNQWTKEVTFPDTYHEGEDGKVEGLTFATRKEGLVLNLTGTVGPDGETIQLVFTPEWTRQANGLNHELTLIEEDRERRIVIHQPLFHHRSFASDMVIADGTTLILGGFDHEDLDRLYYFFVTANVIGPDGKLVRDIGKMPENYRPPNADGTRPPEGLVTRFYKVRPSSLDPVVDPYPLFYESDEDFFGEEKKGKKGPKFDQAKVDAKLKDYLDLLGAEFPEGSQVTFDKGVFALRVVTSPEAHKVVRGRLRQMGHVFGQVEMDLSYVAFKSSDLLRKEPKAIKALWRKGEGRWLGCAKMISRSGRTNEWKSVAEMRYPDLRRVEIDPAAETNALPFEIVTHEAGIIASLSPTTGPDNFTHELTMKLKFAREQTWKTMIRAGHPVFKSFDTETSLVLSDDATLVLGATDKAAGDEVICLFVSMRRLDREGRRMSE